MKYKCNLCSYESRDKSNYNKHLNSVFHIQMLNGNLKVTSEVTSEVLSAKPQKLNCNNCEKIFTCKQHLSRHRLHYCKNIKLVANNEEIIELKQEINDLKILCNQTLEMNKLLTEYVKTTKSTNTNSNNHNNNNHINNTYHVSVKNYLQQNYPNAPVLNEITDYAKLKYDGEYDDFIDALVYNHHNSHLDKYLGNFIIQSYKKDNPSEQSMWSSDISRLTYIIKELLANNNSTWNYDSKGIKIKIYVIDPLLKYIKKHIDEYWMKNIDSFKMCDIEKLNKLNKIYNAIYQIKKNIDNDILGNDVLKYIAPHFYMNRTNKDYDVNDNQILYFIDE